MRPSEDEINLEHARTAAKRTTCVRRGVGCVLVDRYGYVISIGRNGVEKGREHCNEGHPCSAHDAPSGTQLSGCEAIHAEINAIAHSANPREVDTIYVTASPCGDCMKALLALPNARRLVYGEIYPRHADALEKWKRAGRICEHLPRTEPAPRIDVLHASGAMTMDEIAEWCAKIAPSSSRAARLEGARDLWETFYIFPRGTHEPKL